MQEQYPDGNRYELRRLPQPRGQLRPYPGRQPGPVAAPLCMDREERLPLLALPH